MAADGLKGFLVAVNPFPKLILENRRSIRFVGITGNGWRHKFMGMRML